MDASWYGLLADGVLILHLAFIVFVVAGGLLALRWWRFVWVHLPAASWGAFVECTGGVCPLTPLEIWLRTRAAETGFEGGFIDHYVTALLYPAGLTRETQILLGTLVLLLNGLLYGRLLLRRRA